MTNSRIEKILTGNKLLILTNLLVIVALLFAISVHQNWLGLGEAVRLSGLQNWGVLHPVMVHLPIGLVLFGIVLEAASWKNFHSGYRLAMFLLLYVLIFSLVLSVVFGVLLGSNGDYGNNLLDIHFQGAIISSLLALVSLYLHAKASASSNKLFISLYRVSFLLGLFAALYTGHAGASLTHGEDYLDKLFTSRSEQLMLSAVAGETGDSAIRLTPDQERILSVEARAILAHNCFKCHGSDKIKGDLRLDIKEMLLKGGEGGPVIIPGNSQESELIRRVKLPASDEDAMPTKGKRLSEKEVKILSLWIDKGAPWPDGDAQSTFKVAPLAPRNPALPVNTSNFSNPVDQWVDQYFSDNKLSWPAAADERVFVRRLYLDLIGLLPSPEEQTRFIRDTAADKVEKLVDELLSRQDDYAIHWLTFWNDLLRNDYTGTGYITRGRYSITDWLYKSVRDNKSYDKIVEELVSPVDESKGFVSGIRWRGVVNASQTTEMQAAQNVAQVFLGLNLKCASCHNSFINNWQLTDAYGMANVFADSSLEIHRCDQPTGKYVRPKMLWEELGSIDSMATRARKMAQLAKIMTKPENGRLYRTIVNRVWKQLMGRGIIEPVDQMDNTPWSRDLIDWLAFHFQQNGSDLKWLIRMIASSRTYRLPADGLKQPEDLFANDFRFRGVLVKRMTAEQFTDAASMLVDSVFGYKELKYLPAAFTALPSGAVVVRAALVANNPLLLALGRPTRETVTTTRESHANLLQAMEMTNGQRLHQTLKQGAQKWLQSGHSGKDLVTIFYNRAIGRPPTAAEIKVALGTIGQPAGAAGIEDFYWVMLLHPEFQLIK